MSPGIKLLAGGILVAAATGYLALLGASTSWQYYLSVDEVMGEPDHFLGKRVRLSGRVAPGSLSIMEGRRGATFDLAGVSCTIAADCRCLLPDNFTEGIEVVVEGTLRSDAIDGHKIITRCASKYESKTAPDSRALSSTVPAG
jgi:cytochrome c-type biogenesis protein CcmE